MTNDPRLTELRAQITTLKNQRRSSAALRPFKADIFYYLFILPISAIPIMWTGVTAAGFALSGTLFVFLCYLPPLANFLRHRLLIALPNHKLQARILTLTAEMDRLKAAAEPVQAKQTAS